MMPPSAPRKQRTQEHVNADLSIHHTEGFILDAGHTAQRLSSDYGYDLVMWTFDEDGYAESGLVYFQFKAMERLQVVGTDCVFDLDVRDYNLWTREYMPVILVLYDAGKRRAVWLAIQLYFAAPDAPKPRKGAKTVRVRIPYRSVMGSRAIASIHKLKREKLAHLERLKLWREPT
jgi:hypothetical protein